MYCRVSLRALLAIVAALLLAQPASGASVAAEDAVAAALLAQRAQQAYEEGEYERALERAVEAYGLVPAPTLALLEARALVQLDRWLEARSRYRVAARPSGDDAPVAFQRARRQAFTELKQLQEELPQLRLVLDPPDAPVDALRLELDGLPVPAKLVGLLTPRDPGRHVLRYWIDGVQKTQRFELTPRSRRVLVIETPRKLKLPPSHILSTVTSAGISGPHTDWRPYAAWGALGVGAASATAGVLLGTQGMRLRSELEQRCGEEPCPADAKDAVSRYRRARDLSAASYLLSFAATMTGGLLLWQTETEGRQTELLVGVGRCDVRGTF